MPFKYIYLLPIFQGLIYVLTFTVTYTLAAFVNKDIPSFFPYVSDTGARSIQKCIFSIGLGVGSLLMFIIVYIRYRQVNYILEGKKQVNMGLKLATQNKISLYATAISTFHVFGVGCIQVYPYLYLHLYCAVTAFGFGFLALCIQTYISFKVYPGLGIKILNIFRLLLLIIIFIALSLTGIFGVASFLLFNGNDVTKWTQSSGGFQFHLISTFSEWIVILGIVLYITLYAIEFKSLVIYKPNIKIIDV